MYSTDGREVILATNPTRIEWSVQSISGTMGYIRGTMACDDSIFQVDMDWRIVPHRIADATFEQVIPHDNPTTIVIPLDYDGDGQRSYDVSAEGPLERIVAGPSSIDLSSSDALELAIDPKGLLTPNMYAEGTLHLTSDGGDIVTIEVILYTSSNQFQGIGPIDSQADLVTILLFLLALSILPGRNQSNRSQTKISEEDTHYSVNPILSLQLSVLLKISNCQKTIISFKRHKINIIKYPKMDFIFLIKNIDSVTQLINQ